MCGLNSDPTTPDVVYVTGVELYKCQRNTLTAAWSVSNVGNAKTSSKPKTRSWKSVTP